MWFPQRIFHTFRKMNESWSLRWWAKLSGALDKMIESQTKSYTDKLQDITCAGACSHLRLANTSRRFQCACSGDMKTLKLPSSHSPRHSLGHSIGQTDNTLGSAAAMRKEARPNAFSGQQPWQWLVLFVPWLRFTSFVRSFGKKIKWARVYCFRPNQIASRRTTASVKTTNSRRTAMKHHQSISHQQFGRGVHDIKHFRPHQLK